MFYQKEALRTASVATVGRGGVAAATEASATLKATNPLSFSLPSVPFTRRASKLIVRAAPEVNERYLKIE